ncbi:MAG: hypothetical protein KGZ53_05705 [Peptococcaceae bacterium]|nr:hypothetical protein [Peptococcaceae bacterium]
MWRRIVAAVMLTILLFCQANSIEASTVMPTSGTTSILVKWDPPEPE